jgi:DNA invertase Pin-like site-specific DNA recombinase
MQRDASIEDQERLCRERAAREGWTVAACFSDRALSGASLLRPGLQSLLEAASAGRIEIVIAEALDRLSRDQADIATLYKRLSFEGVRIVTLSEGEVSELHVGLKGTMNQLFLKDLAAKTRRGLRGRVEAGLSGGGNSYGYDVVRALGPDGEPITGERTINVDEAAVVTRIFEDYAGGVSPRAIASTLNAEGVPGPRGSDWSASTIHGNSARGTGILNNELYLGRRMWNRLRYIKDPSSGRRVSRLNPVSDWILSDVPDLRILPQDLWDRAKARQSGCALPKGENRGKALNRANRPRFLFSGMVTCGICGGGMSMISATHLGCSRARNKGVCDNRKSMARTSLETRVLDALATRLMDPALFAVFCQAFIEETNRLRHAVRSQAEDRERELGKIRRDLDRLVQAILDGTPARAIQDRIATLEARRTELEAAPRVDAAAPPIVHPAMAKIYRDKVAL